MKWMKDLKDAVEAYDSMPASVGSANTKVIANWSIAVLKSYPRLIAIAEGADGGLDGCLFCHSEKMIHQKHCPYSDDWKPE